MIFKTKKHNNYLYNILLNLSRNIFFYKTIKLQDTYETRIYLMLFHFSIIMIVSKNKGTKFDQNEYDFFFRNIEYNLRELGFGDISVNKKMKDLNKILYDILLKIQSNKSNENKIKFNRSLISKYFNVFENENNTNYVKFETYFLNFFNFCSKLPLDNMVKQVINFRY